ncbi:Glycine oxidase [compost metagenome]
MGEHPEIKGLFIAAGHYRNGILLSPVTSVMIADLIEGEAIGVDLSSFSIPVLKDEHSKNIAGGSTA